MPFLALRHAQFVVDAVSNSTIPTRFSNLLDMHQTQLSEIHTGYRPNSLAFVNTHHAVASFLYTQICKSANYHSEGDEPHNKQTPENMTF